LENVKIKIEQKKQKKQKLNKIKGGAMLDRPNNPPAGCAALGPCPPGRHTRPPYNIYSPLYNSCQLAVMLVQNKNFGQDEVNI
jgi:hypothetical protein